MNSFDEIKGLWAKNAASEASLLGKEKVAAVVRSRIRKEKKAIAGYFWLALSYHILIYSSVCWLFIKFRGDNQVMAMCAAVAALYIPFTIVLMRKFKAMYRPDATAKLLDIRCSVRRQYELLSQFFILKKRFDLGGIPITCLVLEGVLFKLYVPGGIIAHLPAALAVYTGIVLIFGTAAWFENRKHFIRPLRRLGFILKDIDYPDFS
ncbi:hypothetical protein Q4E93_07605 [Flavitalea sp. BT771]|uniref:hypothetical protein n=1 Tax=Flavitalea sp. BT771 TaxID=3063329 RepID=UPI0026E1E15F|nr:hypothetical protein [Flavitalea sp. BT771]MDO6430446.1 hypothetical protein [Flavitalea sp. BT771]MDV6219414.1 hypothetical protein [Flavitalea sp. BT771]